MRTLRILGAVCALVMLGWQVALLMEIRAARTDQAEREAAYAAHLREIMAEMRDARELREELRQLRLTSEKIQSSIIQHSLERTKK